VLYATCFVEYNKPETADRRPAVLAKQRRRDRGDLSGCCGMPQLEAGDIADVAPMPSGRRRTRPLDRQGLRRRRAGASLRLMMKFEWPLILPENEAVKRSVARDPRHQRIRRRDREKPTAWRPA
jgi:glycerol-3-phosphate dehydrogenase subunit C